MRKNIVGRPVVKALMLLLVVLLAGCEGESPSEPRGNTPGTGGTGGNTPTPTSGIAISLSVSNPSPLAQSSSVISATVTSDGTPVPNGTAVEFTTNFGTFNETGLNTALRTTTNGVATVTLTAATPGTATVTARINNVVANASVTFRQQDVQPPPPVTTPTITSISPATGSPAGGTIVTINGTNFFEPVRVFFDNREAAVVPGSLTPTQVRVIAPAIQLGGTQQALEATVRIITKAGTPDEKSATSPTTFRYQNEILTPQVFSVSPASGPNEGNTRITIFGEGFQAPMRVYFGTSAGTGPLTNQVELEVINVSFSQIIAVTPPALGLGAELRDQQVAIRVHNPITNQEASVANIFRYGPSMVITSGGPTTLSALGGQRVKIFGWGFDEPVAVTLAGIAATPVRVSGTEIEVITGAPFIEGCEAVTSGSSVVVTNIEDGASADADLGFTYVTVDPLIVGIDDSTVTAGGPIVIRVLNPGAGPVSFQVGDRTVFPGAPVVSNGVTIYTIIAPTNLEFDTMDCLTAGGQTGEQFIPTSFDITFVNAASGCEVTLADAVEITPSDTSCRVTEVEPAAASANPTAQNFGDVTAAGTVTAQRQQSICNTGGAPLTISADSISGANAGDFTENFTPGGAGAPIAPGACVMFTFTFDPSAVGARTATYTATTNVGSVSVTLSGNGI